MQKTLSFLRRKTKWCVLLPILCLAIGCTVNHEIVVCQNGERLGTWEVKTNTFTNAFGAKPKLRNGKRFFVVAAPGVWVGSLAYRRGGVIILSRGE